MSYTIGPGIAGYSQQSWRFHRTHTFTNSITLLGLPIVLIRVRLKMNWRRLHNTFLSTPYRRSQRLFLGGQWRFFTTNRLLMSIIFLLFIQILIFPTAYRGSRSSRRERSRISSRLRKQWRKGRRRVQSQTSKFLSYSLFGRIGLLLPRCSQYIHIGGNCKK